MRPRLHVVATTKRPSSRSALSTVVVALLVVTAVVLWPFVGPLVLGIYASHNLFVDFLASPHNPMNAIPGWDVIVVAVVFALALALTGLLARFPLTRRLVA